MDMNNLRDMFHEQLKDMYSAEKQLTEALPVMFNAATNDDLKQAFRHHLEVTKTQLNRVKSLLDQEKVNPGSKKCKAMEGLIEEGDEMAKKDGDSATIDAGLIAAAQKVEHYEIASYGALRAWAEMLGEDSMVQVLQEILDEEYEADNTLNNIAEGHINRDAVS